MSDFVSFGDVARGRLGMQCQYACRYTGARGDGVVDPAYWGEIDRTPCFGVGLRFKGSTDDYHFMEIHKDDVEEFVRRVGEWKVANGCWPKDWEEKLGRVGEWKTANGCKP